MSETDDNILAPGSVIAGYRVERELGHGAMAVVYLATQLNLERLVALKVLTQDLAADEEFVGRFMNEAKAAGKMSHPNIIQAYDAGVAEGNIYYFAMEYVEGENLDTRINREGFMSPASGLAVGLDIASALDYGWRKAKLTHGDIKPENIMISKTGYTRLADFGLAKVTGTEKVDFKTTGIMLTPAYAAPEVIRGRLLGNDSRSDIYSFGATMYHVLAGFPPFPGDDADDVMRRQVEEPLTPLIERNPGIHREISDFIGQLLSKDPDRRPADWASVVPLLQSLRERAKSPPATPATTAAVPAKAAAANVKSRKLVAAAAKPVAARVVVARPVAQAIPLVVAKPVGTPPSRSTRREAGPPPPPAVRPAIPIRPTTGSQPRAGAEPRSMPKGTVAVILIVAILINVFALWMLKIGSPKAKPTRPPGPGAYPATGPAQPPGTPLTPAQQEWSRLRNLCAEANHPAKRLDMLDRYKQEHGSELPADFATYYKDCEDALKWRRMTEELERRQQEQQEGSIDGGKKTGGDEAIDVDKIMEP